MELRLVFGALLLFIASYEFTRHGWLLMGPLAAAQDQRERPGARG